SCPRPPTADSATRPSRGSSANRLLLRLRCDVMSSSPVGFVRSIVPPPIRKSRSLPDYPPRILSRLAGRRLARPSIGPIHLIDGIAGTLLAMRPRDPHSGSWPLTLVHARLRRATPGDGGGAGTGSSSTTLPRPRATDQRRPTGAGTVPV